MTTWANRVRRTPRASRESQALSVCTKRTPHPNQIIPAYDADDHLHFNPAGYQAMATLSTSTSYATNLQLTISTPRFRIGLTSLIGSGRPLHRLPLTREQRRDRLLA